MMPVNRALKARFKVWAMHGKIESRFQRSGFLRGTGVPGAMPQAAIETAPLALSYVPIASK
jgi:hypothetical protein